VNRYAIVIPAYNASASVGETVDSLQANTALNFISRVILLDDCSVDSTVAVVRQHWRSTVPLEIWSNERNMGERRTVNAAMSRLSEHVEWTFILHADDVVKPNWLNLYLDAIEALPSTVATVCSSYDNWWPEEGTIVPGEEKPNAPAVHVPGTHEHVVATIDKGCWWHISGSAIRNDHFAAVGPFEPDMPQLGDWEWLLRCLSKGYGVWYLPRTTMLYRQHARSVSSGSFREARDVGERMRILSLMRDQSFLTPGEHAARKRRVLAQLARRTLVRLVRRDPEGFKAHARLLMRVALLGGSDE